MDQTRKQRLNPSKLLVLLMYGSYPYLTVRSKEDGVKELTAGISEFAKLMRVRKPHIVEYLKWLEQMGFLVITDIDNRKATVLISTPPLFMEAIETPC